MINLLAFHQHIVYIHFHVVDDLILENLIGKVVVSGLHILQLERHNFTAVKPFIENEGHLQLILEYYFNLVVTQEHIHEAKHVVPQGGINEMANPEETKIIF